MQAAVGEVMSQLVPTPICALPCFAEKQAGELGEYRSSSYVGDVSVDLFSPEYCIYTVVWVCCWEMKR